MPDTDANRPLAGLCIWVTRPQHQALAVASTLSSLGAETLLLPLLEIVAFEDRPSQARLQLISDYDLVIFVSANAVEFSLPYLKLPVSSPEFAAIGATTAAKCREKGIKVDFVPKQADSEGLLALPRFQRMQGQRVLLRLLSV